MTTLTTSVCVFCGANEGTDPVFREAAQAFGGELGRRGHPLVYGGASSGLMGQLADATLAAGGRAIGVFPHNLASRERAHPGLTEQHYVDTLAERKNRMILLAGAFVILPGGYGTLDELFEVLTLNQVGAIEKPVGLLNLRGYYDHLIAFLDHATASGLLKPAYRALLHVACEPAALLDAMVPGEVAT